MCCYCWLCIAGVNVQSKLLVCCMFQCVYSDCWWRYQFMVCTYGLWYWGVCVLSAASLCHQCWLYVAVLMLPVLICCEFHMSVCCQWWLFASCRCQYAVSADCVLQVSACCCCWKVCWRCQYAVSADYGLLVSVYCHCWLCVAGVGVLSVLIVCVCVCKVSVCWQCW